METQNKSKTMLVIQLILLVLTALLSALGIIGAHTAFRRMIVYAGECVICIALIICACKGLKQDSPQLFKGILYAYAVLDLVRSALLSTMGVKIVPAFLGRFLLAVIACTLVLCAERSDNPQSMKPFYALLILEIILLLVFMIGFPGVLKKRLDAVLPLTGPMIAAALLLFQKRRLHGLKEPSRAAE